MKFIGNFVVFLFSLNAVLCQEILPNSVCGSPRRTAGYIDDGKSLQRGDAPWLVALISTQTSPPTFICSGTLVSSSHVVTAAHCIRRSTKREKSSFTDLQPKDMLALFGANDLLNPHESGRTMLSPEEIFIHVEWKPNVRSDADIAVLKFEDDEIPLTKYIRPVCLWNSDDAMKKTDGFAAGWGRSTDKTRPLEATPKQVKLTVKSNGDCHLETAEQPRNGSKRAFCAELKNATDVCLGDSGHGFFIKANNLFYLKGIISASAANVSSCDATNSTTYTDVTKFRAWIDKILSGEMVDVKNATVVDSSPVSCVIKDARWNFVNKTLKTCGIENLTIATENVFIDSAVDSKVEGLSIQLKREVKFLPQNISETFTRLIGISVTYCGLTFVNENSFRGLKHLKYLCLDENYIEAIATDAFRDLVKLKQLSINYNQLETLHSSAFRTLRSLKELSLTGNKIQSLKPDIFNSVTRLEKLNLDANRLQDLHENIFEKLTNLKEISLDGNQLNVIPANLFSSNLKVEQILLSENSLRVIPNTSFDGLACLTIVDLRYNDCVDNRFLAADFATMRKHLVRKCSRISQLG